MDTIWVDDSLWTLLRIHFSQYDSAFRKTSKWNSVTQTCGKKFEKADFVQQVKSHPWAVSLQGFGFGSVYQQFSRILAERICFEYTFGLRTGMSCLHLQITQICYDKWKKFSPNFSAKSQKFILCYNGISFCVVCRDEAMTKNWVQVYVIWWLLCVGSKICSDSKYLCNPTEKKNTENATLNVFPQLF